MIHDLMGPAELSAIKRRIFIIHGSQHLTNYFFNGDGLVAWGFINELAGRGHRIHVATDRLDLSGPIPENLTVVEFPRIHRNGVLHYLSYMRQARRYYDRLVATEGVDVVHQMNPVVRGLSLALLGRRVPIILGTYVGDWGRLRTVPTYVKPTLFVRSRRFFKVLIDAIQQHFAAALVLATPHALERIPLSFDVASRIQFLHHGVDIELYNPLPLATDPPRARHRILYVGSLRTHKGIFTLADAFAAVVGRVEDASLVMVGDGPQLDLMKERLARLGVLERVTFAGRATRDQVAGWMRASDVLCAPSFGEPYGQNVVEAMATGMPVVITTEGGHRHLGDAAGSFQVEPGNVTELALALSQILLDPSQAQRMGAYNRGLAEQRHAWPRVTDQLEAIYERAITRTTYHP